MALDLLNAAPARFIDDRDGFLSLVEVRAGDADVIGPLTSHEECEAMARSLLAVAGPGLDLPVAVHKLCLAYLAARGVERLP